MTDTTARDAAIQAVKDHPSTTFMAPYESLADAVLTAATPLLRAEILRDEMKNLRRIEREDTPEGALGTRTGLLRAALILDERAETAEPETTHQGPHPEHGGLETHIGTRDTCTGPDCGPRDPEDEIRDAVLDLEALHSAAYGSSWRIVREEEDVYDASCRAIGIEPTDGDADIVVFQADDISEEDAAYIAAMGPSVGRLLADLLHEIAEGMESSALTPVQEAARKLANKINNRP